MAISLASLNAVKASDTPYSLDIIDEVSGASTGITLQVIGAHSEVITKLVAKAVNAKRTADTMQAKKGKEPVPTKVEDDIMFSIELAAKRIVGWTGIEEPFSPENAIKLCEINPAIREQVVAASENPANYK
jgi:hypothetical protein